MRKSKMSSEERIVRGKGKIFFLLIFSLYALYSFLIPVHAYYGQFYDGTGARDSVWMNIATFDTLGFQANSDSVWFWRFFRTAVIDSTILTGAGTRTGYYVTGKRAFDGTNFGEYTVQLRWKIQGKYFNKSESYTVFSDSVTGVGRISTNLDKTNYQLASGQVVARADSVTGVGRLTINLDKSDYSLSSNYLTKADSGSSGASYLRAKHIEDKIGYRLSSQGQADIWINDTTGENSGWAQFFKGRLDASVSSRLTPGDSGIIARAPWDNDLITQAQRRVRYVDSLGEEVSGGGSAANPDTIANHVWIWNSRTLTSGAGAGTNQVIITTKQSSDSTPIAGAQVQVLNYEQTATTGLLTTNPSGQAAFALDNAIYKVRMFKPGWQFTVPESLVVSGNSSITFYASLFDPGLPPSAELCRVYGWIKDLKGLPVVGVVVEAKIISPHLRYQSVLISPYYKTTNSDSDGYWYLDLYPNSRLSPPDTQYDFTIYIPYGTILKLKTTVPEQSSWELQG